LIAARERAGLSREQLAQRLGRPVSFVARIEGGQGPIRLREFYALATALHLDPRELLQRILG
jgi:transcriptional regulator with XRE-family HTH domain